MNETLIILFTGLIGLFSAVLKIAVEMQEKQGRPDEQYKKDIQDFDSALAVGNSDVITAAFEHLRRASGNRSTGGPESKPITER